MSIKCRFQFTFQLEPDSWCKDLQYNAFICTDPCSILHMYTLHTVTLQVQIISHIICIYTSVSYSRSNINNGHDGNYMHILVIQVYFIYKWTIINDSIINWRYSDWRALTVALHRVYSIYWNHLQIMHWVLINWMEQTNFYNIILYH